MFSKRILEDLDVHGIEFEKVIPLVANISGSNDFKDMIDCTLCRGWVEDGFRELAKALSLPENVIKEYYDNDELDQMFWDHDKHGLLAEISIPEWEYLSESHARSTRTSRIYLVYVESYDALIEEAIKLAKNQRKEEIDKWRNGQMQETGQ